VWRIKHSKQEKKLQGRNGVLKTELKTFSFITKHPFDKALTEHELISDDGLWPCAPKIKPDEVAD